MLFSDPSKKNPEDFPETISYKAHHQPLGEEVPVTFQIAPQAITMEVPTVCLSPQEFYELGALMMTISLGYIGDGRKMINSKLASENIKALLLQAAAERKTDAPR
jgi:hypothetical protein